MKTPLIEEGARAARAAGAECVVVLGLGFVGTAVAANLSRTRGKGGEPLFFVIGLDLDAARAARLDEGRAPTYANAPSLEQVIAAACRETQNLVGTTDQAALRHGLNHFVCHFRCQQWAVSATDEQRGAGQTP
mgnify:CR=1 FL=1